MKIIVTGGAGFIASHIVDGYINKGHKVVVIDNLIAGSRKNVHPKAKFYKADVRDQAALERIFKKERPEIVSHHAALINVVESIKNPASTIETNVQGTMNVLATFGRNGSGKKKIIFASSSAVYGEPISLPVAETHPQSPLSTYGLSKLFGEELVEFYARELGLTYTIFRYTNVYGPRQKSGSVMPIFVRSMKHGIRPTIFGDGTKNRDYLHVSDVVPANIAALQKGNGEIINLGWGTTVSDRELFHALAANLNFGKKPVMKPYRKGEIYSMALSARKAKKILGWKPKILFADGIRQTLETL